jgi:hypothetical protein
MLHALMFNVGLRLLGGDDRGDVLNKIDSAFLATSPLPLLVLTAGALVVECGMASLAEPGYVASLVAAFRAFHIAILSGWGPVCATKGRRSSILVNGSAEQEGSTVAGSWTLFSLGGLATQSSSILT